MSVSKILHVTAYYPPHLGGQEVAVHDLAEKLTSVSEQIEVVTSALGSTQGVKIEDRVRVTRLKSYQFAHTPIIWSLLPWLVRNTDSETTVHLHVGQFFTPEMVWLASKIVHFKYIIHFHADLVPSGTMGRVLPLYKKLFLGREIRDAEVVVVLSEDRKDGMLLDYPNNKKIAVMSNGIGDDFFQVPRNPVGGTVRLLFVGRLDPHKNLARLLEALELAKGNFVLDIVGDGEHRQELESLVSAKKLSNVTFHGRLSRDLVKDFYSVCSALVLPSLHETQGIVLLEAMACRIPIIASKTTGLAQTLEGAAILVEPTVQGIAEGIAKFATTSTSDLNLMIATAFERVQAFSWKTLMKSYTELYGITME